MSALAGCASDDASGSAPVNFLTVTETLDTAGQPDAAWLAGAGQAGYQVVINLAPPDAHMAVAEEPTLLADANVAYQNIPVDWENPTDADFERFREVLSAAGDQRVLVHCQMNMRASAFTFLYRVIDDGVDPDEAWESVTAVWVPDGQWRRFIEHTLRRYQVDFTP